MSTLYRDYRPQNFSEILGQNHIKITLQNEISSGRLAHAYLFCGPRAVGKTTLARVLAKAVNCEKRKDGSYEPCNQCPNCLNITAGRNLDVVEIDAASNTGVDNVRENIIAFSRLTPAHAQFKVFIIDEVHMLSISAFNALLKIIEEPPTYVIFILCTTEIQKVPGTIISRCERFDFKRISVREIVKKLTHIAASEKIAVDTEVLEAVARRSGGHLRDAESLLGQIFSLGDKKVTKEQAELVIPHYNSNEAISLLDYLAKKDAAKAIALVNTLTDSGVNVKIFTSEIIGLLREVMLNKLNPELADNLGLDLGENLEKRLSQVADDLNWEQLTVFTRRFLEAFNDSKSPLIPQLPLELAIVELCCGVGLATPRTLTTPPAANQGVNIVAKAVPKINQSKVEPLLKSESATPIIAAVKPAIFNAPTPEVLAKWPEFLVKIKKYNHSLSFVLQNCQPQDIQTGKLGLVFKYKFHLDRLNEPSIKKIVESTLAEVFGEGLSFTAMIDENLDLRREEATTEPTEKREEPAQATMTAPTDQPAGGLMADLLKAFGGEVIN